MNLTRFLLCAALIPLMAGCSTQQLPEQGYSVRQAIAMQTLNPNAGGTEPMVGLDGKYAQQTMVNYQETPLPSKEAESEDLGSLFKVGDSN